MGNFSPYMSGHPLFCKIRQNGAVWNHKVEIRYIQPGKPAQNAYIERFNRTYREEVLDRYLFKNIAHVQRITDTWLAEYNNERTHEALGNLTPKQFVDKQNFSIYSLY